MILAIIVQNIRIFHRVLCNCSYATNAKIGLPNHLEKPFEYAPATLTGLSSTQFPDDIRAIVCLSLSVVCIYSFSDNFRASII